MAKLSLYPKSITQPNKNQSSGLAGTCFNEIRRNGKKYNVNCSYQKDPKYHHQWINTENLKSGKEAQCGKASKYHCNHKTYYNIKGYRNTCPIAGVSGTYTQPATLRMGFDVKNLASTSKVNQVTIKFKHRCVGVDVANSSTTVKWGPNFYGFKHYPKRKVLRLQFVDKNGKALSKEVYQKPDGSDFDNPPLSTNYSEVTAVFKDVSYSDLKDGFLDLKYGNNLSTNPGNIYITGFKIEIDYDPKIAYIDGKASSDKIITSQNDNECATTIDFNLEVGYKSGTQKIAPQTNELQNKIFVVSKPEGVNVISTENNPNNTNVIKRIQDKSGIAGNKKITFGIEGTDKTVSFNFEATLRKNPMFEIPPIFEHNVLEKNIPIIARDGCASRIRVYLDGLNTTPIFTAEGDDIDISNQKNILKEETVLALYSIIAQQSCGFHTLYIQMNDDTIDKIEQHRIRIDPVQHKFSFTIDNKTTNVVNQSGRNAQVKIKYETKKNFIVSPKFSIKNPIDASSTNVTWKTEQYKTATRNIVVSKPGTYNIIVTETNGCTQRKYTFPVIIEPTHKQYYDTLYVKTEGPTSFDYEYLTVWEGDKNEEPVYMDSIVLKNSANNLCFSAPQKSQSGLTNISYFPLNIKNNSNEDINNLFIELNVLRDNNGQFEVTTDEWVETDGMFINFKNNFEELNSTLENLVSVINLTPDNDFIDEENVYLKINEIKAGKSLTLKIPFGSRIEKEIILQLLMFEIPIEIYPKANCTGTKFTDIKLNTYDSILTDLQITGEFDLFDVIYDETTNDCYFETDITYTAKNIDSSSLKKNSSLVIENDPRLIPVGYISGGTLTSFDSSTKIRYESGNTEIDTPLINQHVYAKFTFLDDIVYNFEGTTDEYGQVRFFVTIPEQDNNTYTIQDIINEAVFEYKGVDEYSPAKLENGNNQFNKSSFSYLEDNNIYRKNETIIVTAVLTTKLTYIQNKLIFNANIRKPGAQQSITIRYKINNLKHQSGILYTKFKTNELELIPNEITKKIYCRINTNLIANSYLMKHVVEEREINTLHIALSNKERDNKNIKVKIDEINLPDKYEILNTSIDIGQINIEEGSIIWNIDYLNENEIVRGIFDFIAKDLEEGSDGLSNIQIIVTDFLSNKILPINENCECD